MWWSNVSLPILVSIRRKEHLFLICFFLHMCIWCESCEIDEYVLSVCWCFDCSVPNSPDHQKRLNHSYYLRSAKLIYKYFRRLPAATQKPLDSWECLRQAPTPNYCSPPWEDWVSAMSQTLHLIIFPLISILYNSNCCHISFSSAKRLWWI